ncbi:hypothetical protein [Aeromonas sp.]|uniref:hypothetical protein n=1 Tax=Aeromonas sp. TaxID=647 RepID=UPI00258C71B5|nr:hypothetical protein [Aeromonas sp.]MCX7129083.1 hypothetical protein [Aeromonas sp.]
MDENTSSKKLLPRIRNVTELVITAKTTRQARLMAREGASLAYSGHVTPDNRHKFQEAISRMSDINVQDQIGAYKRNLATLNSYMSSVADAENDLLPLMLIKYKSAKSALSNLRWENAQPNYKVSNMYGRSQIQDGWNVKN